MVLPGQLGGRVGRRRSLFKKPLREILEAAFRFCSKIIAMTHMIELAPEVERVVKEKAQRQGIAPEQYLRDLIESAVTSKTDEVAILYEESVRTDGALTAFLKAQEDLHEYSADELAAMESGEFATPLNKAAA